jgi:hypothetical protein
LLARPDDKDAGDERAVFDDWRQIDEAELNGETNATPA